MFEWLFENRDRITASVVILCGSGGVILALHRGWFALGREIVYRDEIIKQKDEKITELTTANSRLVSKLEEALDIARTALAEVTRKKEFDYRQREKRT